MNLGDIIKAYRIEHHLSQAAFAEKSGISKGYVSMLENNRNPQTGLPIAPTFSIYEKVARVMGITPDDLIRRLDGDQSITVNVSSQETDDAELMEYLEYLRTRPEARILMSTVRGATKEEVEENVRFIEALRKSRHGTD